MASSHLFYLPKSDITVDGSNYKEWATTLRVILRRLHLWGHIDSTTPAPPSVVFDEASSPSATSGTVLPPSPPSNWKKWHEDDSWVIFVLCQSVEISIRMVVCEFPTAKEIWDHLRQLYLPSSQAQKCSLVQTLASAYQRDRSVQAFFAELSDLWRQLDGMFTSGCSTCMSYTTIAQERDHLRMYEFPMRLRPEFESVLPQMMHRAVPPSLRDSLAVVIAEETRLHSFEGMHHSSTPHSVLVAPQHGYS